MPDNLKQRPTALITGGSKGLGLAFAREFARHGHDLVLVARDEAALQRAASVIGSEYGVSVTTLAVNLTRTDAPTELSHMVEQASSAPKPMSSRGLADNRPNRFEHFIRGHLQEFSADPVLSQRA